ncbi:gag-pol polyprotein [Cucumis melo var. makuwa]|uniref:Gag-pol polyprotein n=1 Tax=Cucumis melo var. makuwa TaxID=1194695 RepID=A0A5D3C9V6_CUCMM|nr:gag-pol polyprotein [Cucumis melo var. makuwa]TYK08653.1 gag-pol polyprotein [Cucumis melo var. makuwa]
MGEHGERFVAGWEPPMITVDEIFVPKSEVDWTDAKEQATVENAKAHNTQSHLRPRIHFH